MKILVTGITGLFGSYLAREFIKVGELHGLKRKESKISLLGELTDHIRWHEGDINDYQSLEEIFQDMDLIVHAAGLVSFDSKDKKRLIEVNAEGTTNVVNVMLQKGLKKLIYISSVAALGRSPGISMIDENNKWISSPQNTHYAISKYLGELEVWRGAQEGLQVMIANPSLLLGKISDQRSSTEIYNYVLQENRYYPLGDVNYLDVRDAAKMLLQLYQKDQWNERFILNKESISYKSFFEELGRAFEKKAPHTPISESMLELALIWIKISSVFSTKKFPLSKQTAKLSQQKITFDNRKSSSLLDFEYTSLESTLAWALGNSI
ncbi:MAG: NAD-dependent epimerase/dehydratase family protein [Anditalea sp.]